MNAEFLVWSVREILKDSIHFPILFAIRFSFHTRTWSPGLWEHRTAYRSWCLKARFDYSFPIWTAIFFLASSATFERSSRYGRCRKAILGPLIWRYSPYTRPDGTIPSEPRVSFMAITAIAIQNFLGMYGYVTLISRYVFISCWRLMVLFAKLKRVRRLYIHLRYLNISDSSVGNKWFTRTCTLVN